MKGLGLGACLGLAAFGWMGSVPASAAGAARASVSFDSLQSIFNARCTGCHKPGGQGPFSLLPDDAYGDLVPAEVDPGDTLQSALWLKVSGNKAGSRMPLGQAPLTDDQIKAIGQWIMSGAPAPVAGIAARSRAGALAAAYANPYRPGALIRVRSGIQAPMRVGIHDLAGALVRTMEVGPGAAAFAWDGRDQAGRALGSGTYFLSILQGTRAFHGLVRLAP